MATTIGVRIAQMGERARLWKIAAEAVPEPAGDELPELETLQAFVGGYVEHVFALVEAEPVHLFVNEDGLGRLPANELASQIWGVYAVEAGGRYGRIDGNVWLWIGPLPPDEPLG
jgi:hypothetical protein